MENRLLKQRSRVTKVIACLFVFVSAATLAWKPNRAVGTPDAYAANCNYDDNLSELAQSFIGRCCEGKINREFPSEYYNVTLSTILSEAKKSVGRAKDAYKLLNDNRFRK